MRPMKLREYEWCVQATLDLLKVLRARGHAVAQDMEASLHQAVLAVYCHAGKIDATTVGRPINQPPELQ